MGGAAFCEAGRNLCGWAFVSRLSGRVDKFRHDDVESSELLAYGVGLAFHHRFYIQCNCPGATTGRLVLSRARKIRAARRDHVDRSVRGRIGGLRIRGSFGIRISGVGGGSCKRKSCGAVFCAAHTRGGISLEESELVSRRDGSAMRLLGVRRLGSPERYGQHSQVCGLAAFASAKPGRAAAAADSNALGRCGHYARWRVAHHIPAPEWKTGKHGTLRRSRLESICSRSKNPAGRAGLPMVRAISRLAGATGSRKHRGGSHRCAFLPAEFSEVER